MKALLLNPSSQEHSVSRDMAGGLGFDAGEGESMLLPPIDLAWLAARLLAVGWQAEILDAQAEGLGHEEVLRRIRAASPDVVLGEVSLPSLDNDCGLLRRVRGAGVPRVFARTGISHAPLLREALEKASLDALLYGEADLSIERLFSLEDRRGSAWLDGGELRIGDPLMVEDLDALPLPARELLPQGKYHYRLLGSPVTTMQTTRGCPYSCGYYCPYPLVQGKQWRFRSAAHVLAEIEDCVRRHGVTRILFRDATLTLNRKRAQAICQGIVDRGYDLAWWCETRVDCLDRPTLELMKKAGCRGINVGVETGDEALMEGGAKEGLTLAKLRDFRRLAEDIGIEVHFLLMVGLPGDTRQSILRTYDVVRELRPDSIGVTVITPYPGTPIYQEAKAKGWIESEDWSRYDGHQAVMRTDRLTSEEMVEGRNLIHQGFVLFRARGPLAWLRRRSHDVGFRAWAGAASA